jgi:hypothetical protein
MLTEYVRIGSSSVSKSQGEKISEKRLLVFLVVFFFQGKGLFPFIWPIK